MTELLVRWCFRRELGVLTNPERTLRVSGNYGPVLEIQQISDEALHCIQQLQVGIVSAKISALQMDQYFPCAETPPDITRLFYALLQAGAIEGEISTDQIVLASIIPLSRTFEPVISKFEPIALTLNRFSYLRTDGSQPIIENPEVACRLKLHCLSLLPAILGPGERVPAEAADVADLFCWILRCFGFLEDASREESHAEQTWEFHDRLFHKRTRIYDDLLVGGGTYRLRSNFGPWPAVRPIEDKGVQPLPAPRTADPGRGIWEVMEARKSIREVSDEESPSLEVIGELLYRTARVKETQWTPSYEVCIKPCPSGGALGEIEFYLAIRVSPNLEIGLYRYLPTDHALQKVSGACKGLDALFQGCSEAWGIPGRFPHCLILLASRFPRVAWKYESIAYRISILNAGVAIYALCLACTQLGLAGCPIGTGANKWFEGTIKTSSWEETLLAEFAISVAPTDH